MILHSKINYQQNEKQPTQWEKIFANEMTNKGLISNIHKYPDPSSKATLWVKAQHEGALPPPCIVRKDPRVPHTARRGA